MADHVDAPVEGIGIPNQKTSPKCFVHWELSSILFQHGVLRQSRGVFFETAEIFGRRSSKDLNPVHGGWQPFGLFQLFVTHTSSASKLKYSTASFVILCVQDSRHHPFPSLSRFNQSSIYFVCTVVCRRPLSPMAFQYVYCFSNWYMSPSKLIQRWILTKEDSVMGKGGVQARLRNPSSAIFTQFLRDMTPPRPSGGHAKPHNSGRKRTANGWVPQKSCCMCCWWNVRMSQKTFARKLQYMAISEDSLSQYFSTRHLPRLCLDFLLPVFELLLLSAPTPAKWKAFHDPGPLDGMPGAWYCCWPKLCTSLHHLVGSESRCFWVILSKSSCNPPSIHLTKPHLRALCAVHVAHKGPPQSSTGEIYACHCLACVFLQCFQAVAFFAF